MRLLMGRKRSDIVFQNSNRCLSFLRLAQDPKVKRDQSDRALGRLIPRLYLGV
jgi:hypothetical protein